MANEKFQFRKENRFSAFRGSKRNPFAKEGRYRIVIFKQTVENEVETAAVF